MVDFHTSHKGFTPTPKRKSFYKPSVKDANFRLVWGFTLIELLIVIGILAVLATVTLLVINPAQLVKQSRDGNRITEINQLNQALLLFQSFGGSNSNMGNINTIYISLPATNPLHTDCSDYPTLPTPPSGWAYHCSPLSSYRNIDSTGWVPVDFTFVQSSAGTLFSTLPIDPIQGGDLSLAASNGYYYTYIHSSWAVSAGLESDKYLTTTAVNDGGQSLTRFELGNDLALDTNLPANTGGIATVPGAPTIGTATAGYASASVSFSAPSSNGGSTITGYTAISNPGGLIGTGSASPITVTGLTNGTAYTFTVTATNALGTSAASAASNSVTPLVCDSLIYDIDNNSYSTILIGTQCWMAENIRTTKYPDGSFITRGPTGATWDGLDHGYYAYPPAVGNTAEETLANIISGKLGFVYQWSAAMHGSTIAGVQGICPTGWHVPTDAEWKTLVEYAAGTPGCEASTGWQCSPAGTNLKTGGTSGFNGILAGVRLSNGYFDSRLFYAGIWSSVESGGDAWERDLGSNLATVNRYVDSKAFGFSVRCLKN